MQICPRCRRGLDHDSDGNCGQCANLELDFVHDQINPYRLHLYIPFGRTSAVLSFKALEHPVDGIHMVGKLRQGFGDLVGVHDRLVNLSYDPERGELSVPFLQEAHFVEVRHRIAAATHTYQMEKVVFPFRYSVIEGDEKIAHWAKTGEITR